MGVLTSSISKIHNSPFSLRPLLYLVALGVLKQAGLTRPKDDTGGVSVWLGLQVGKNAWTDGSPGDYTHWNGGKPSGAGQCARLELAKEGQWGDIDCNNSVLKHAVCQIPAKC
ncbi:C-type lectin protein [Aphelenchoides avenae]|nr:C-type lectin protein [Aphelenchus avenae]